MAQKSEAKEGGKEEKAQEPDRLAAVRIRGTANVSSEVKDTLEMLRLDTKNNCIVVEDNPSYRGMLKKVAGVVAWGEVDSGIVEKLEKERGKDGHVYRLHPPRGGFERKGIKMPYSRGGALGYRGDDMKELLEKMI